jgi:hypothetical protein
MTVNTTALSVPISADEAAFALDQRRATAYASSGYWPDAKSMAQALVKVEAGRALGLPALVAMSEVHVIDGKPSLGAGAYAALVKAHPRYDYRVVVLTDVECELAFYEGGAHVGGSRFTIADAEQAGLKGRGPWKQYPRNMLFARAMSNGCAWFAPDVTMGRVYTGDEIDQNAAPPPLPEELPVDIDPQLEYIDPDIDFGPAQTDPMEPPSSDPHAGEPGPP